ncbi:MAG: hypothetical protein AAF710_10465 [Planctomycetota bacterium]
MSHIETQPADPSVTHTLAEGVELCELSPDDDANYFFGYYDKSPYDAVGRYALAGRAAFDDRMPTPDDVLTLGRIETAAARDGQPRFEPLAETTAWCWQQGTMLQWLPPGFDRHLVFNARRGDRFVAVVLDTHTRETRELPRPVYAVDPRGRYAVSLNFARLARSRPGYGYEGLADPHADDLMPADDGLWWVPLDGDAPRLILSVADAVALAPLDEHHGVEHWFNHAGVNPDGSRISLLHRWRRGDGGWKTRLLTVGPDGRDGRVVADCGYFSHYDWVDPRRIVGWTEYPGRGESYVVVPDGAEAFCLIDADRLDGDGHMSLSPDRTLMLSDTYPEAGRMRRLFLWGWPDGPYRELGRFFSPRPLREAIRTDLHPRWRRDGRAVCIDSAHAGRRAVYEVKLPPAEH